MKASKASSPSGKKAVNWKDYIHTDPSILVGKPVLKNTRLSVDFILGLLGSGWTRKELFESYPQLTDEALQAVFAYASECLSEESLFLMPAKRS